MAIVLLFLLFLYWTPMTDNSPGRIFQPHGSQFPWPAAMVEEHNSGDQLVNPRVVFCPTADTEASSGAKNSGYGDAGAANLSKARQRAYRRARRRAEANGITIYRGRWRSAKSLGTTSVQQPAQTRAVIQSPARPTRQAKPRILH